MYLDRSVPKQTIKGQNEWALFNVSNSQLRKVLLLKPCALFSKSVDVEDYSSITFFQIFEGFFCSICLNSRHSQSHKYQKIAVFDSYIESGVYLFVVEKEEYIAKLKHFRFKVKEAINTEGMKMLSFKISLSAFRTLSMRVSIRVPYHELLYSLIVFVFIYCFKQASISFQIILTSEYCGSFHDCIIIAILIK